MLDKASGPDKVSVWFDVVGSGQIVLLAGTGDEAAGQGIASAPTLGNFVSASGTLFCSTLPRNPGKFVGTVSTCCRPRLSEVAFESSTGGSAAAAPAGVTPPCCRTYQHL